MAASFLCAGGSKPAATPAFTSSILRANSMQKKAANGHDGDISQIILGVHIAGLRLLRSGFAAFVVNRDFTEIRRMDAMRCVASNNWGNEEIRLELDRDFDLASFNSIRPCQPSSSVLGHQ